MEQAFSNGRVVDLILALLTLEAGLLFYLYRRTGRGIPPAELLGFLLAGGCLLLALRAALTGAGWQAVAAWLALAGLAQAYDLWRRGRW